MTKTFGVFSVLLVLSGCEYPQRTVVSTSFPVAVTTEDPAVTYSPARDVMTDAGSVAVTTSSGYGSTAMVAPAVIEGGTYYRSDRARPMERAW